MLTYKFFYPFHPAYLWLNSSCKIFLCIYLFPFSKWHIVSSCYSECNIAGL